jgi:hypothetical protein
MQFTNQFEDSSWLKNLEKSIVENGLLVVKKRKVRRNLGSNLKI